MLVLATAFKETGMTSLGKRQAWLSLTGIHWNWLPQGKIQVTNETSTALLDETENTQWLITGRVRSLEVKNTEVQMKRLLLGDCADGRRKQDAGQEREENWWLRSTCSVPHTVGSFTYSLILKVLRGGSMSSFTDGGPTPWKWKLKQVANTNMGTWAVVSLNPKVLVFTDVRFTDYRRPCNFYWK